MESDSPTCHFWFSKLVQHSERVFAHQRVNFWHLTVKRRPLLLYPWASQRLFSQKKNHLQAIVHLIRIENRQSLTELFKNIFTRHLMFRSTSNVNILNTFIRSTNARKSRQTGDVMKVSIRWELTIKICSMFSSLYFPIRIADVLNPGSQSLMIRNHIYRIVTCLSV